MLEDFNMGNTKKRQKLKHYIDTQWEEKKGDKNASIYFLKDDFMKQWADANKAEPIKEEQEEPTLFSV